MRLAACTARSMLGALFFSANCGTKASAMITATSGTSTSPSRKLMSRDSTSAPTRLCIVLMNSRSE